MRASVRGGARVFFSLTAAVFSVLFLAGCELGEIVYDDNIENVLVLPAGQAWIDRGNGGKGLIFTLDRRIFDGTYIGANWKTSKQGMFSIPPKGNTFTQYIPWDSLNTARTYTVKISADGKTMTRTANGKTDTFTKTLIGNVKLPPFNPGTGGELVLDDGEAWINDEDNSWGVIYKNDSTMAVIAERGDGSGVWEVYAYGIYLVDDGQIVIILMAADGTKMTGTYTVKGNSLVMTIVGEEGTRSFTKRSGIYVITPPPPTDNSGSIVGDWTPYSSSLDGGEPILLGDDPDKKVIITFKETGKGTGDVSSWGFEMINKESKVWVETPFEDGNVMKWRTDDKTKTIYITPKGSAEYVWGTYIFREGQLIVSGHTTDGECDNEDGCDIEETFKRVYVDIIKAGLDGLIIKNDPKIRGEWVLQGNDDQYISFENTRFNESPAKYAKQKGGHDYIQRYYTRDNNLLFLVSTYEYVDNNGVPSKGTEIVTLGYSISNDNKTLTITDKADDIWILIPENTELKQNKRPSSPSIGKSFFSKFITNKEGRLQ